MLLLDDQAFNRRKKAFNEVNNQGINELGLESLIEFLRNQGLPPKDRGAIIHMFHSAGLLGLKTA